MSNSNKLPDRINLDKCNKNQCFFHSAANNNCRYNGYNIGEIKMINRNNKDLFKMFLDNKHCPEKVKEIVKIYKLEQILE